MPGLCIRLPRLLGPSNHVGSIRYVPVIFTKVKSRLWSPHCDTVICIADSSCAISQPPLKHIPHRAYSALAAPRQTSQSNIPTWVSCVPYNSFRPGSPHHCRQRLLLRRRLRLPRRRSRRGEWLRSRLLLAPPRSLSRSRSRSLCLSLSLSPLRSRSRSRRPRLRSRSLFRSRSRSRLRLRDGLLRRSSRPCWGRALASRGCGGVAAGSRSLLPLGLSSTPGTGRPLSRASLCAAR